MRKIARIFSIIIAVCIVVLQATCIFWGRGNWTFLLARAIPESNAWNFVLSIISTNVLDDEKNIPLIGFLLNYRENNSSSNSSNNNNNTKTDILKEDGGDTKKTYDDTSLVYCLLESKYSTGMRSA